MNLVSFVDELVKVGAARCLVKRGEDAEATSSEPPHGMVAPGAVPDADRVHPAEAATRLPLTGHLLARVVAGALGDVTQAKQPIDAEKFNRVYRIA